MGVRVSTVAEPEFVHAQAKTIVLEQTKLIPPKRKSKSTETPLKHADTEPHQTRIEPKDQKSSFSSNDLSIVTEETKLVPTTRKSNTGDFSKTYEAVVTHVRSLDLESEQKKKQHDGQKSSTPEVVKEPTHSQKLSSTQELVTAPLEVSSVEKGKLSPTKRKSKGLKLSPEGATTELTKSQEELVSQKPSTTEELVTATTHITVVEKEQLSPTKGKSKGLKHSPELAAQELIKTKEGPQTQRPSSTQEMVTTPSGNIVVDKGELPPTKRELKGLKLPPEPATTELTKTKEELDSQKPSSAPGVVTAPTEISTVEKGKLSPTKRKSKGLKLSPEVATTEVTKSQEEPVIEKPSPAQESVTTTTTTTEITVVEKGELSPTKGKSKGLKPSPEVATTELTKTKEEQDSQKPSSTPGVVTTPTEVSTVEKGKLSPTKRKSKGLKLSPEVATTEVTKSQEEPVIEKPSPAQESVTTTTTTTEITVVEKGELSPTKGKSKGLKPSPEVATTELTKTKEEQDSQKPSSTPGVVTTPTEVSTVEKGKLSPTKRKSKGLKLSPEVATTEVTKSQEEPVIEKPSPAQESVTTTTTTTEITVVEKGELSPTKGKSKGLKPSPEVATTELTKTKEEQDSQKPSSTPGVVTTPTELSTVEKGKLSPTKRKSKGLKLSPEVATTEVTKMQEESVIQEPSPAQELVTATTGITVVEKEELSPTKRKPKGPKVPQERPTTELTKTKEEQDSQKPSSTPDVVTTPTELSTVERGKLSPTKRKSKGLKLSPEVATTEVTKSQEEHVVQKPSPAQELVTTTTEITVVEKAELSPTKRKSKGLKLYPEVATTEVTKTKGDTVIQKPSPAQELVTTTTEITVVEKGELSPTKGKSKGLKPSPEVATTELTKTKEEQVSQKPETASTLKKILERSTDVQPEDTEMKCDSVKPAPDLEVVTGLTEISVVEETEIFPPKRRSKNQTSSPNIADTEPTQKKGEPTNQEFSSSSRKEIKTAVVGGLKLAPTWRKPKSPELSRPTQMAHMEPEQDKKQIKSSELTTASETLPFVEMDSQQLQAPETTMQKIDIVGERQLPIKDDAKSGVPQQMIPAEESQTTVKDVSPVCEMFTPQVGVTIQELPGKKVATVILDTKVDTCTSSHHAVPLKSVPTPSELQQSKDRSKEAPQQTITQSTERDLSTVPKTQLPLSPEPSDTPSVADYIHKLWENTEEKQKRYLVLDLPDTGVTPTHEIKPSQPEAETVVESDSIQPTSVVFAGLWPYKGEKDISEKSSAEQDIIKPSETVSQLKVTQEQPKEFKDYDIQKEHVKVLTCDVHDAPKSLDEKSVKKIHLEPEVRILQLDIQTSPDKDENASVTKAIRPIPTSIQSETVPDNKDITTADVEPEKVAIKMTTIEVRESSTEHHEQHPLALPPDEAGTEFVEISISEQGMAKPSQTETQRRHLKTTKERPKVVKEHGVQEQQPTLSTQSIDSVPKSLDKTSVTKEKIHMVPEVRIPQLDKPTNLEKDKKASVTAAEEPMKDTAQASIKSESMSEIKGITPVDVKPEKAAGEMTKTKVQKSGTECQDSVAQRGSAQPTPSDSESLQPHKTETEFIEISLYEQDIIKPGETDIKTGLLRTAKDRPTELKEHGVQKEHDLTKSLDEKTVGKEKIHKGERVLILQPGTQATIKQPEVTSLKIAKASKTDTDQTSIQGKKVPEKKDMTSANVQPEKAADQKAMVEVKTKEKPKEVKDRDVQEMKAKVLTTDMRDAPQSLDEITIVEAKIPKGAEVCIVQPGTRAAIKQSELTPVTKTKTPKTDTDQTSIQGKKVPEKKDLTPADVQPKKAAVEKAMVEVKTKEKPKDVKDHDVQGVQAKVSTKDVCDVPQSLDEKTLRMEKIQMGPEVRTLQLDMPSSLKKDENATVSSTEETRIDIVQTSIRSDRAPENKDKTTPAVKLEKAAIQTRVETQQIPTEMQENVILSDSKQPTSVAFTAVQPSEETTFAKVYKTDKRSPASLQAVQKSSADFIWGEVSLVEGLPLQESKTQAEAAFMKTEKLSLREPKGSAMRTIFTEIHLLSGTGPTCQFIEGKPLEAAQEGLITSTSDLDNRLSRLVSKVLSCKNQPAELNPTAMAKQLEEVQECRETAQAQVSLLSQLKGADAENKDALEHVTDQWTAAVQDAAAVIQTKEAQLQLVTDYCKQTQEAKNTLDRLTTELAAVRTPPEESSSKEAERLCALLRSTEENRTVLGELLVTHTKLCPHLSSSERATAQTGLKNLQGKWGGLEWAVERSLYHTNVHAQETSSLLSAISGLQEQLETTIKDLEAMSPSATQWNCKKAQQLMVANADVKAAQQKYLHLQQLSEAVLRLRRERDTTEIQQGLQRIKDQVCRTEELVSSQTQNSTNPIMEKIIVVMRDGFAWAKQTESDIEGRRKRVALLPEEVHRQLRDLKKLQSEVMAKQGQLESLVEEVTELLPQLDQAEEVPMVRSSLESLEDLSKLTTEKLAKAVRDIESGLQTREKLSEQIADLDSWVLAHLHRDASRSPDSELRSPTELDRRVRQIQETLAEAEKQAAVCEALLMKSKDIAPELSITENCQLFDKLTDLQRDIRAISSYEKANKNELDTLTQTVDSSKKNLIIIETSLRQMLVDVNRHKFPITSESLQALEPFKHMILEHKSQLDLLQPWIPQEKSRELHSVISELLSKMVTLEIKARGHEEYLNKRQCVEDLRESVQEQVSHTKDDKREPEDRCKLCQTLLVQLPLIKYMSEEAGSKLQMISADLYPSQLSTEQQRLKQNEESLHTLEMTLYNNLSIIEWSLQKELDLNSEKASTQAFLLNSQQELQTLPMLEPNETVIDNEYQRIMSLKKTVESRIRALEVLEQKKGSRKGSGSKDLMELKKSVLRECDSHMENISQAKESLRGYTCAVRQAAQFLRDIEFSLLPPQGSAGPCSERLEETQQALVSLQQQFQTHVEKLQSQVILHPYLCPQKLEQFQENILSQLLVRMSTLQARGHLRLEHLSSCAEHHRKYTKYQDEIIQSVKSAENSLSQFICQKVTCLADCTDQQTKLGVLSEEVESLQRHLQELKEWCPEQSCRGGREAIVAALWKRVARLRRCTRELTTRNKQSIAEWSEITNSVENASALLDQVEAELPDGSWVKASTEDLHELLQSWEQYQDRLDCEHRALSALELRTARLQGVPAHLEQAPPTPLCQRLQAMQGRYNSVKQRSKEGLKAARMELEDREKLREELQGVRVWLEAADGVLSEMKQTSSTQELQEVHSQLCNQKALVQRIMESLKMKYSDMYTLVPAEIESQLQEVNKSLQQVEVKVAEAVEKSGPVHRLAAKLSEIHAGLTSVQKRLEQKSPNVTQAKITQKRVWDELDVWHSCLAALEVDMQDLEKPEEAFALTERLVEVQQLHSHLAKQAEQRTTLLSKIHTWLQEHQEMITSSKSWMTEAKSWLATPCIYTTAKCLSSHVHTLQMVLDDSAQIRTTLQGFSSVLKEMSPVCDITTLQEQLVEVDQQVANVQESFTAPLSQLGHAADEVEAIESEVRRMETDVAEIKTFLSSPETFPSPREESLKAVEQRIQSMRRTVAEIQKCKPGLCLPEKAEETLTVFGVVDQLQTLLLELEKKVPALFIQQPPTPVQAKAPSAKQTTSQPQLLTSASEEAEKEQGEQGQIRIAHVGEDVLKRTGASLQTVEQSSPEQRQSWTPESTQWEHQGVLQAEEATEKTESQEQTVEEGGGGVLWWLWDAFLGASPEETLVVPQETEGATGLTTEQTGEVRQDVESPTDTTEASSSEALSKSPGTVTAQSLPESMVNASTVKVSKPDSQQKCVVS
uniref:uncharacterized protein LOC117266566 isoform X2 n=1 Tax=Epinephelus lanceolatus TaxID=310571 RepID=UPI00144753AD|nr:uncharacterized protein LOC117266566 isoform X2 [Epinephelus lanceolatus]